MKKRCVNVPIRSGIPDASDVPAQMRLHADRISNQEVRRPVTAVLLEFYDEDTTGLLFFNITTNCARERIPLYTGAIAVLMRAIELANAEAST